MTREEPTPRQIEIIRLISQGHRNAEAAKALFISEKTVKYHLYNAGKIVGARHRSHLIAIGFRRGWLE